jgi:hypothetical protein
LPQYIVLHACSQAASKAQADRRVSYSWIFKAVSTLGAPFPSIRSLGHWPWPPYVLHALLICLPICIWGDWIWWNNSDIYSDLKHSSCDDPDDRTKFTYVIRTSLRLVKDLVMIIFVLCPTAQCVKY